MRKFNFKFNITINIILGLIIAVLLAGIIYDAVFMSFAIKDELSITAYIISLVILILLALFLAIFKFGSFYKIDKNKFVLSICLLTKKIDYSDLLNVRYDKNTKKAIMYYYTYNKQGEQLVALMYLYINTNDLDIFVNDLKEKNNLIIYDIFGDNENGEDK